MLFFFTPLLSKNTNLYSAITQIILAALVLIFNFIINLNITLAPFVFCVLLLATAVIGTVFTWNAVSGAYDIRTFKSLSKWFNIGGSLGSIAIGFSITFLIVPFGTNFIIYILSILLTISSILLYKLDRAPVAKKLSKLAESPLKYPAYKIILLYSILNACIYTLVDYVFKIQLATHLTKLQIGQFVAEIIVISSCISIFLQLKGITKICDNFGIVGLLAALPLFLILFSFGMLTLPGLIMAAILSAGWEILTKSYSTLGKQFVLNILPVQTKQLGKFYFEAIAFPLGVGISSLVLFIAIDYLHISIILIMIILLSITLLYLLWPLMKCYRENLKKTIKLKHFDTRLNELDKQSEILIQQMALKATKSSNLNEQFFGLLLFRKFPAEKIPNEILKILDTNKTALKIELLNLLVNTKAHFFAPQLFEHLEKEHDNKVLGALLTTLSELNPTLAQTKAEFFLTSTSAEILAGAISILLKSQNPKKVNAAIAMLKEMVENKDINMRRTAATIINPTFLSVAKEYVKKLIQDKDESTSMNTIVALQTITEKSNEFIPLIINKLANGKIAYHAVQTLITYGNIVTPYLLRKLKKCDLTTSRNAIKTLALMEETKNEDILFKIYESGNTIQSYFVAKTIAYKMLRDTPSKKILKKAKDYIFREINDIQLLLCSESIYTTNKAILREIMARINLAKQKYLYWFGICTDIHTVLHIFTAIFDESKKTEHAYAIELLDSLAYDRELKSSLKMFEYNKCIIYDTNLDENMKQYRDTWLQLIIEHQKGQT